MPPAPALAPRVVIIDDDSEVLRVLRERIAERHEVAAFTEGDSALRALMPSEERVMFVIDRSGGDKVDALDLRKRLASRFPNGRFILTLSTLEAGVDFPKLAHARGFDACLAKPYPLSALMDKIEKIERDWQ
jgi:DNA-binding NtrC family response regulator